MFTRALFIIAPNWKQWECPSAGEWIQQTVIFLYDEILLWKKKKQRTLHKIMAGSPNCYAEQNKTETKRYIPEDSIWVKRKNWPDERSSSGLGGYT